MRATSLPAGNDPARPRKGPHDALQPQGPARHRPGAVTAAWSAVAVGSAADRRDAAPDPRRAQGRRWHRRADHRDPLPGARPCAAVWAAAAPGRLGGSRHQPDGRADTDRYAELQDRRRRQRRRRLRAGRRRELDPRLLVRRARQRTSRPERPCETFTGGPSTGCGQRDLAGRAVLLPGRPDHLPRHHLLRRRSCRGSSAAPTAPSSSPTSSAHEYGHHIQNLLGHDGQGAHPAGPAERRGPAGAAGRLLRRHVGPGPPRAPRLRRRRADHRAHRPGHPGGDRRRRGGRRRPDPAARRRAR